jgi:hypothetical protein
MLVRDVQVHRTYLVQNLSIVDLLSGTLKDRASYFSTLSGDSRTDATVRALGWIHEEINRQALLLCYIDCFRLLMYVSLGAFAGCNLLRCPQATYVSQEACDGQVKDTVFQFSDFQLLQNRQFARRARRIWKHALA